MTTPSLEPHCVNEELGNGAIEGVCTQRVKRGAFALSGFRPTLKRWAETGPPRGRDAPELPFVWAATLYQAREFIRRMASGLFRRVKHLGLDPDPRDRTAKTLFHG